MQERVCKIELSIIKLRGDEDVADGLTKHVERNNMDVYMDKRGFALRDGRHVLCPHLANA